MDKKLLQLLVCPVTKGGLLYDSDKQELISLSARLAYPVRQGMPILLQEQAREINQEEYDSIKTKANTKDTLSPSDN